MPLKTWGIMRPSEFEGLVKSIRMCIDAGIPGSYVELGIHRAKTSWQIYKRIGNHKFIAVDCDARARRSFRVRFRGHKGATFIFKRTTDAAPLVEPPCAWVLIDACHCFECATVDIQKWGEKIFQGGHLVLHDTSRNEEQEMGKPDWSQHLGQRGYGVQRAVKESEFLARNFKLLFEIEDLNGLQVYERL